MSAASPGTERSCCHPSSCCTPLLSISHLETQRKCVHVCALPKNITLGFTLNANMRSNVFLISTGLPPLGSCLISVISFSPFTFIFRCPFPRSSLPRPHAIRRSHDRCEQHLWISLLLQEADFPSPFINSVVTLEQVCLGGLAACVACVAVLSLTVRSL